MQEQTKGLLKQAETSLVVANHWLATHPQKDPGKSQEFAVSQIQIGKITAAISVSTGVAQLNDGESGESLLQRSDDALYRAKENGRNQTWVDKS